MNNPNAGAVIQAYKEGDYDGLLKSQEALQIRSDASERKLIELYNTRNR
ncbi:hypothetical protein [Psychrobacter phenylpyruvicus]|nr:hypothetical protein [Psychrobacter phenylpyruvicus]